MKTVRLDELTTLEVEGLFADKNRKTGFLLPVGCTEQHGPYLPIGCDTIIARGAAQNAAIRMLDHPGYRAVVMPELAYTPSPGGESFLGTVSVSYDFLGDHLREVIGAALKTPWKFVVMFNGHAHNQGRVIETSVAGSQGLLGRKIPIVVINIYEFDDLGKEFNLSPSSHAGEMEIALYHYYSKSSRQFTFIDHRWETRRTRPGKIFGLDIAPRSNIGVISDDLPNVNKTLEISGMLGKRLDDRIMEVLISNLDIFFSEWD